MLQFFFPVLLVALVAAGCKRSAGESHIDIANGAPTTGFPSVVYISSGGSACTGTFISSSTLVTAAHCVHGKKTISVVDLKKRRTLAQSQRIYANPKWTGGVSPHDLALVVFPAGSAPAVSRLATVSPKVGDNLTIVGFGHNNNATQTGSGTKRYGTNKVTSVTGGYIQFRGSDRPSDHSGRNALSGRGDSGGPLFINNALAGVTSGGGSGRSAYVNLLSADSQAFLRQHLK